MIVGQEVVVRYKHFNRDRCGWMWDDEEKLGIVVNTRPDLTQVDFGNNQHWWCHNQWVSPIGGPW